MLQLFSHKTFAEEWQRRVESDNDTTIDRDVFDGMRGKLTQSHIDAGTINNCRKCPMALALNDMFAEHSEQIGQHLKAEVNRMYVYIFTEDWRKVVIVAEISGLLDEWIKNFDEWIKNFDEGETLPPGEIYIEKDGLIEGVDGDKVQHWSIGLDVPDAYYLDPLGDDST